MELPKKLYLDKRTQKIKTNSTSDMRHRGKIFLKHSSLMLTDFSR